MVVCDLKQAHNVTPDLALRSKALSESESELRTSALVTVTVCDLNQAHNLTPGLALRSKTLSKTESELTHQPWSLCLSAISTKLGMSLRPCSEIQDLIQNRIQAHTSALTTVLVCDVNQAHNVTPGPALRSKTLSKTRSELTHQP